MTVNYLYLKRHCFCWVGPLVCQVLNMYLQFLVPSKIVIRNDTSLTINTDILLAMYSSHWKSIFNFAIYFHDSLMRFYALVYFFGFHLLLSSTLCSFKAVFCVSIYYRNCELCEKFEFSFVMPVAQNLLQTMAFC